MCATALDYSLQSENLDFFRASSAISAVVNVMQTSSEI